MPTSVLKSKIPKGFVFSQSSLQEYSDCPRRFQLRYLEKLHWPAVETEPVLDNERRQVEGQTFHLLIQQYLLGLPSAQISQLAGSPNLDLWWQNFRSSDFKIKGYAQYPELPLSCPIGEYRLLAKYDLVAINPLQKALIFDWKTYTKRPRDEWMISRWQTRVYRSLLVKAGIHLNDDRSIDPNLIEMIYWYADFPNEPARFTYNAQQFSRDWSAIEKLVDEISSSTEFSMTDDENLCRFCQYRSYCERGTQAGILDKETPEAESDNDSEINIEQIGEIEF